MSQVQAPLVVSPVMACRIGGNLAALGSDARPSGNTLYYRLSLLVLPPTKTALNTIFQATVIAPLLAATHSRYTPGTVNIRDIQNISDPEQVFVAAGAGAIGTDCLQTDDAVVVCLQSAARGQQGKAFKHFGGPSEIDTTGDVLTGAGLARWQAVRDAVKSALVDALGNTWVPFVKCNFGASYSSPPVVVRGYDVINAYLNTVVGVMRKRKAKGIKSF
jgi:hypothetical protein